MQTSYHFYREKDMCTRIVYSTINSADCAVYVCGYDKHNERLVLLYRIYKPTAEDCYMQDERNKERTFARACELFVEDNQTKEEKDLSEYKKYPLVKMCELIDSNNNYVYREFHSSYKIAPCAFYDKVS